MNIADYYNFHKDETCLIAGVSPNLGLTPPEWFDFPSFGINTIYKTIYKYPEWNWKPTYFVGVDDRLFREDGDEIFKVYADVPKFIPFPDRDDRHGNNVLRFHHRAGDMVIGGNLPNRPNGLIHPGIAYRRIMDAVMQIAWYMGFTTMLMIGVQHKPGTRKEHFWGTAYHDPADDFIYEEMGYAEIRRAMGDKVKVLNISEDTYVPLEALPRDDWRKYVNQNVGILSR